MERLNLEKNNLRKFGITMSIAFLLIAFFMLFSHKNNVLPVAFISLAFFVSASLFPAALRPVYIIWMRMAFILDWINTRLLLCLLFYTVLTGIGLGMRIFRVDLLGRKMEKDKASFWRKKERKGFKPSDYERRF